MTDTNAGGLPLKDKCAFITGASSGFGKHFAKLLTSNGAKVAITARRTEKLEELAKEIGDAGGTAIPIRLDVKDPDSIKQAIGAATEEFGKLHILLNNSGVANAGRAIDMPLEDFDHVMETNVRGAWQVAQQVAQNMAAHKEGGSIVNIASVVGLRVQQGIAPYAVSKAAVIQMTKAQAVEWARFGIRVNAIAPGYYDTDIAHDFLMSEQGQEMKRKIPMRRFGEPSDMDGLVMLLAGDGSRYMTGTIIPVDGGHTLSLPL